MTTAVDVADLVKRYPKSRNNAVDGLSFRVRRGEIFGLLGPNGAGKTTTVGVLTTRIVPTSGKVEIGGIDVGRNPVAAKTKVAVVPQRVNLDRSLNARQNLLFHATYHGVGRSTRHALADELLDRMGLAGKAKARVDDLSGGQSQRLMIARALIHHPEVLFLDEPATGLDPQARLFLHDRIADLRSEGITVVLTTHDMDEAEKLSDRVGIVDHGRMLTVDTPSELIRSLPGSGTMDVTVRPSGRTPEATSDALAGIPGIRHVERLEHPSGAGAPDETRLRLYVAGETTELLGPVAARLHERAVTVTDLALGSASLEDVFIDLTGRDMR